MNDKINKIDTSVSEKFVFDARMSCGDMGRMVEYITGLGEQVLDKDLLFQSLVVSMYAHLDLAQVNEILKDRPNYARQYMSRHTTADMFKKLANEGFPESTLVLIDVNFANEAIDNSQDVFAIKDGKIVLLERYHEGTKYSELGYLLAIKPFAYESECLAAKNI